MMGPGECTLESKPEPEVVKGGRGGLELKLRYWQGRVEATAHEWRPLQANRSQWQWQWQWQSDGQ